MILTYHEVVLEDAGYLYGITSHQLDAHLGLMSKVAAERSLDLSKPVVTFDDGHISNYELALPLLQKHGIAATFFVTTDWIEQRQGFMTWSQLQELLALGHSIGSHGATHQLLTHCSPAELLREVQGSKQAVEDALGVSVSSISMPGGRWNSSVVDACSRSGYRQVYVSDPTKRRFATNGTEICGRLMIQRDMTANALRPYLLERKTVLLALRGKTAVKAICMGLLGDAMYGRLWRTLAAKNQASYE